MLRDRVIKKKSNVSMYAHAVQMYKNARRVGKMGGRRHIKRKLKSDYVCGAVP